MNGNASLKKFVWLSVAAAVLTIVLKTIAWRVTGSVGLFSDALESCVNLVAALVALYMITVAEKPADEEHVYGHEKAEYFSSAIEGGLITLAAVSIGYTAVRRLVSPQELNKVDVGLMISVIATLINLGVALVLLRTGKSRRSITLEADGKHLMSDVVTTAGVIFGIILVKLTGWLWLDPLVALLVAINIIWWGIQLMQRSAHGLLDTSISRADRDIIDLKLMEYRQQGLQFHSVMTRQAGQRRFVALHVLVPGDWTVQKGHDLLEDLESELRGLFSTPTTVFTHLEPVEDPRSMSDIGIDRV